MACFYPRERKSSRLRFSLHDSDRSWLLHGPDSADRSWLGTANANTPWFDATESSKCWRNTADTSRSWFDTADTSRSWPETTTAGAWPVNTARSVRNTGSTADTGKTVRSKNTVRSGTATKSGFDPARAGLDTRHIANSGLVSTDVTWPYAPKHPNT